MKISVLITCYNRKQKTLACLESLFLNVLPEGVFLEVFLVDDGSTDGTADAVRIKFPSVHLAIGDSNLFWCRGMHKAFELALQRGDCDYFLWLNDDTMLRPDALARLLECALTQGSKQPVIVVGSTIDEASGKLTYGGEARTSVFKPLSFQRIVPGDQPQRCDSMTGNIVLIPSELARTVGNLDPVFEHAMGDTDYALRARQLGFDVWLGPGVYGSCADNSIEGTFLDASQPLLQRWRQMMSRKGLPWRSWLVFTRRHTGRLWLLYFAWPYVSLIFGGYRRR
jgi:GT2 family glycosyltransferase